MKTDISGSTVAGRSKQGQIKLRKIDGLRKTAAVLRRHPAVAA